VHGSPYDRWMLGATFVYFVNALSRSGEQRVHVETDHGGGQ
jgi:hypothetical protein